MKNKYPWEDGPFTLLLRERIDKLSATKTQREIAADIGYSKPNILSMYKRGEAKVPLERLPEFSRALGVDVGLMLRLWLEQTWPNDKSEISRIVSDRIVTANERALLKLIRTYLGEDDPEISLDLLERLRRGFAE
ncbi:hypothetical protein [Methylobacterium sp. CM6247]